MQVEIRAAPRALWFAFDSSFSNGLVGAMAIWFVVALLASIATTRLAEKISGMPVYATFYFSAGHFCKLAITVWLACFYVFGKYKTLKTTQAGVVTSVCALLIHALTGIIISIPLTSSGLVAELWIVCLPIANICLISWLTKRYWRFIRRDESWFGSVEGYLGEAS